MKLDPRPARTDLTSREVSKILGGVLGPLLAVEIGQQEVREVHAARQGLRLVIAHLEGRLGEPQQSAKRMFQQAAEDPLVAAAAGMIGGVATGLSDMAPDENILTALRWWDQDRAWDALGVQLAEASATFLSWQQEPGGSS